MSYTIAVSAEQLKVIKQALQTCPTIDTLDEFDTNVQTNLVELIDMTLTHPESDRCVHGFIL